MKNQAEYLWPGEDPNEYLVQFKGHFSDCDGYRYHSTGEYWWYSYRYDKWLRVYNNMPSDGATGVPDLRSNAHWFHDVACNNGCWSDDTPMCNRQASFVLYDIMQEEAEYFKRVGHTKRYLARKYASLTGWIGTWLFGGGAARKNGMIRC